MKALVTGSAGFIGSHVALKLLQLGHDVVGVDSINSYYDVELKYARLFHLGGVVRSEISESDYAQSHTYSSYKFYWLNTQSKPEMERLFANEHFDLVCHLASQSGVRYSVENPYTYIENNINGFLPILEGCRHNGVKKLLYASSSSVYGDSMQVPFSESDRVDSPISLYAATKRANELMAYAYSHLYGFESVGLRFFTVYGPWGRPDMAPIIFARSIASGQPLQLFNCGDLCRDFTYIDDIVEGVIRLAIQPLSRSEDQPQYHLFNIGSHQPVRLTEFIEAIEHELDRKAIVVNTPMQAGDVHTTYADVTRLQKAVGFAPNTSLQQGIKNFVDWYKMYYKG